MLKLIELLQQYVLGSGSSPSPGYSQTILLLRNYLPYATKIALPTEKESIIKNFLFHIKQSINDSTFNCWIIHSDRQSKNDPSMQQ